MTESYCTNDENEITIKIAGYDPEFGSWILKSMFPTPKELLPLIGERIVFTTPSNRPLLTKENDNAKDADSLTKLYCSVGQDLDVTVIENIYDETFVLDDDEVEANSCNQGKYTAERDEKIGDNATVAVHQSSGSLDIVDSLPSEAKLNNRPGKQDEDTNDNSNSQKKKKRRSSTDWDSLTTPLNPATTVGRRKRRVLPAVFSMATKSRQMSVQSAEGLYQGLNDEQKRIHDWIVAEKENALITGSAGTGKSVLLKAIISTVRSKYADNEVAVTASTGIAALNIDGVTVHR
ncbi:hypothetical protein BDF20DRAFT_457549 [Mycotypha africana]|uniref:uncharacterized protein n=1 Tax=Mycotypha africana TaxID=64632 RepID=UPI0023003551|nr:uncharacterized protein BDF20DRAFT_457549 [Mycotypha africana]KAI8982211.1 hypothetical protein BDF20DRAFT_457549 [Mycotypha africana]